MLSWPAAHNSAGWEAWGVHPRMGFACVNGVCWHSCPRLILVWLTASFSLKSLARAGLGTKITCSSCYLDPCDCWGGVDAGRMNTLLLLLALFTLSGNTAGLPFSVVVCPGNSFFTWFFLGKTFEACLCGPIRSAAAASLPGLSIYKRHQKSTPQLTTCV